ncbi:MAG: DUF1501 domain-containing protein [Blastocatellia bacterium]|nr:DUF1501 domain-containing protein [Blastocatellia bacterium]
MKIKTIVLISLRGGIDGLNVVIPYKEENYFRLRPSIAVAKNKTIELDNQFALHQSLASIFPLYEAGQLAFIHAVGWPSESHSHFQVWEEIELGVSESDSGVRPATGWIARYLQGLPSGSSALRAVSIGEKPSRALSGLSGAATIKTLADFQLAKVKDEALFCQSLKMFYSKSSLKDFGMQTFDALGYLASLKDESIAIDKLGYPNTEFGHSLHTVEKLIKSGVGLEAACVDFDGWDTHFLQPAIMEAKLSELAEAISTFTTSLGEKMESTLIVAMSEFGRRVQENASQGTDHGQGGLMFVSGAGVEGGRVYTDWPGLGKDDLVGPGDLRATTDVRDVLSEIVQGNKNGQIFPGYSAVKRFGFLQ